MPDNDDQVSFAIAISMTTDHALMACFFLAKLRSFHPDCPLFIMTDEHSQEVAAAVAATFAAERPIVTAGMSFNSSDWGPILTAKFSMFLLPTALPIVFLDIDQIITKPLTPFVSAYLSSSYFIMGGADDETLGDQFKPGMIPRHLNPNQRQVINTGAIIFRRSDDFFDLIQKAIPRYNGLIRLPTQGLINGLLNEAEIPFEVFGDEFMIGPFNRLIADRSHDAALIHLWTPRPPFMHPQLVRKAVDGDLTWAIGVDTFEKLHGVAYPYDFIFDEYMRQAHIFFTRYETPRVLPPMPAAGTADYMRYVSSLDLVCAS